MTRANKIDPNANWRKAEARAKREKLEKAFEWQLRGAKLNYSTQFVWHPTRKWRADFHIWPSRSTQYETQILVEIQGGNWIGGRHVRGAGYEEDIAKMAEAQLKGYKILWGTAKHIKNGQLLNWVERALRG